jgi:hypothetical protein
VLRLASADREKLYAELPPSFKIDPQLSLKMVTGTWRQIIHIPEIPFMIELFELSQDDHDQSRFSRRQQRTLLGRQAWLPTAEDVIVQKLRWSIAARRGKDFDDAVAVIAVQEAESRLDWTYIEKWCAEHGTLEILAEARAEAAKIWEDDPAGD